MMPFMTIRAPGHGGRLAGAGKLLAACAVLALAGCKTTEDPTRVAGWTLVDPSERHPILVSQQPTSDVLRIARGSNGLSPAQRARLLDFANHFRATDAGNSRLVIEAPSGAANEVSTMRAVGEIRSLLADQGFGESTISVQAYNAADQTDPPIRVSYLRYVAQAPQCGDWSTNLAYDPMNLPYQDLGCANQHNLAVMVANPSDLVTPRSETARSSERRDVTWSKYVRGQPTGAAKSADERVNQDNSY